MEKHILQAEHNQAFLDCVNKNFPDAYFDWKITISFYIAIHLLKALAEKRGKKLGETHVDIFNALGPRATPKLFQIPPKQWENYYFLYQYSRSGRYDGFIDLELHEEIQKTNFNHCCSLMTYFVRYVKSELSKTAA
jgi:hypothetical protein